MSKPEKLYHASPYVNVDEFQPRNNSPRYSGEIDLVFATPNKALAAMFLAPRDIPVEIGIYGHKYVLFIEADESTYIEKDKGGAIYTLPSNSFKTDTIHGMKEIEWYSEIPVKPLSKVVYETSTEAMDKFGVKRYFVDSQTMKKIRKNPGDALNLVE